MKTVIAGLEEGLNAIADALEGGGGGGGEGAVVPTPTLDDEGKVLKAIPQSQEKVAPEWDTIRELPIGGREGQVLTRSYEGYEWETPNSLPPVYDEDNGKALIVQYDSDTETTYPAWSKVATVPSSNASDNGKILTCTGKNAYGWAPASGGGGNISTVRFSIPLSNFTAQTIGNKSMYIAENISSTLYKLSLNSKLISISASPYNPMEECYNLPMDFAFVRPGVGTSDIAIPAEAYTFASGLEGVDTINVYITYYTGA